MRERKFEIPLFHSDVSDRFDLTQRKEEQALFTPAIC